MQSPLQDKVPEFHCHVFSPQFTFTKSDCPKSNQSGLSPPTRIVIDGAEFEALVAAESMGGEIACAERIDRQERTNAIAQTEEMGFT